MAMILAAPVLVFLLLSYGLEPAGDAGFMSLEDADDTGFFPFLAALFAILALIVAAIGAGVVLLIGGVTLMVVSAIARKRPSSPPPAP